MKNKLDFIGTEFRKKLKQVINHLDKSVDVLYEIATKDEKTGLYNNRFFREIFDIELENAKRGKVFCLIVVDIDFFKKVNDKYGHLTGDRVLKSLAKILQKSLRKKDIIARFGGEEFFVLLPDTIIKKAEKIAERLRKKVEESKVNPKITISLGVSEYKKRDNFRTITNRADKALYKAKEQGRNKVVVS